MRLPPKFSTQWKNRFAGFFHTMEKCFAVFSTLWKIFFHSVENFILPNSQLIILNS